MKRAGTRFLAIIVLLAASACAVRGEPVFVPQETPSPAVQLSHVPLVVQQDKQCAAASLEMAARAVDVPLSQQEWQSLVFTPQREGALPSDMLTAPRRKNLLAISLSDPQQLPKVLAEGYPVIVLFNLRFDWWPQWHYAVVTGYDTQRNEVLLHTGRAKPERWQTTVFERMWHRSGHWGLVLSTPSRLPFFVTEDQAMRAAIGLEKAGSLKAAYITYHEMLTRFPHQCASLMGMGNSAYALGLPQLAKRNWTAAANREACTAAAQNNLAEIEGGARIE